MSHSRARATGIVGVLFLSGLVAGALTGTAAADRATDPYAGLDLFARVITLVEDKYIDELPHEELVDAAVRGIMDELDDHSRYLDEDEYAAFQDDTNGNYEGIGVEVRLIPEGVLVANVFEGGPAKRDGLLPNDRIVAVDGESIAGFTLEQVAARLKGPRGDAVVVTIEREGWETPQDIETVRDRVHPPSVTGERIGDISYIRLLQFQDDCASDVHAEYKKQARDGTPSALILDLRDNPGGLLDQAVAVSDLFLDEGRIVSTRSRVEGESVYEATRGGISPDLPLVILVNGMSASASEIVAGAVQDTGRGTLIGTHTYGKGSVQTLFENRDGTAVKLTVGRYYTPSGEPVAAKAGRVPDHIVEFPTEATALDELCSAIESADIAPEQRLELQRLAEEVPAGPVPDVVVPWSVTPSERGDTDPQLAFALDWLLPDDLPDEVVVPGTSDQ